MDFARDAKCGEEAEKVTVRGRVERTFEREAVMCPRPVAGEWGLLRRSILGVRPG